MSHSKFKAALYASVVLLILYMLYFARKTQPEKYIHNETNPELNDNSIFLPPILPKNEALETRAATQPLAEKNPSRLEQTPLKSIETTFKHPTRPNTRGTKKIKKEKKISSDFFSAVKPICTRLYPTANLPASMRVGYDVKKGIVPMSCMKQISKEDETCFADKRRLKHYNPFIIHTNALFFEHKRNELIFNNGQLTRDFKYQLYKKQRNAHLQFSHDEHQKFSKLMNMLVTMNSFYHVGVLLHRETNLSSCEAQSAITLFELLKQTSDHHKKQVNIGIQMFNIEMSKQDREKTAYGKYYEGAPVTSPRFGKFSKDGEKTSLYLDNHQFLIVYPNRDSMPEDTLVTNSLDVSAYLQKVAEHGGWICDPWNNGYFNLLKSDTTNLYSGAHPWSTLLSRTMETPSKLLKELPSEHQAAFSKLIKKSENKFNI